MRPILALNRVKYGGRTSWRPSRTGWVSPRQEDAEIEWWSGLSQKFLSAKCARMLVLAGQERLDRDLMVGQM